MLLSISKNLHFMKWMNIPRKRDIFYTIGNCAKLTFLFCIVYIQLKFG